VYSKVEVLEATSKVKVTKANVLFYINQYKTIAKSNMVTHGIPASIILAQGILESGTGKGSLSLLANNHFGIKCKTEWTGPSVFFDDDAEHECFRKYENGEESYIDHAQFLSNRSYYIPLFSLEKDDYKAWAYGLKEAGYATDVKYPSKLISIIERYNLQQFDAEVLGKVPTITTIDEELVAETDTKPSLFGSYQVLQGDTLYSISRKFNISVPDLIKKNNIENNSIAIGQYLIINKP
jgi:LysM repeat protein